MTRMLCDNVALHPFWHPVAASSDVHPGPIRVTLLGQQLALWRDEDDTGHTGDTDGNVTAVADRCPHREAPLSAGRVADGCLVCPYHGWSFDGSGRCVAVPSASPGVPPPPRAHVATLPCREQYGLVWVSLARTAADVPDIPDIPQESDPAFRRINTPVEIWRTSTTRMVDNFLDVTHFPFVHTGTFGRAQDTAAPKVELEQLTPDWFGYRYEVLAGNSGDGMTASGVDTDVVHRRMTTGFSLPFNVRSEIHYPTGLSHILLLLSTPIDDVTSYFTFVVWRNDDFAVDADEVIRFDLAIGAEDRTMLEQLDGVLPLEPTALANVQADRCAVEWRRRLAELLEVPDHPA